MSDDNKQNLQYFEAASMCELYDKLHAWQLENAKRFLSLNINKEADRLCCIALTNPTEVIIVDGSRSSGVDVTSNSLRVRIG